MKANFWIHDICSATVVAELHMKPLKAVNLLAVCFICDWEKNKSFKAAKNAYLTPNITNLENSAYIGTYLGIYLKYRANLQKFKHQNYFIPWYAHYIPNIPNMICNQEKITRLLCCYVMTSHFLKNSATDYIRYPIF